MTSRAPANSDFVELTRAFIEVPRDVERQDFLFQLETEALVTGGSTSICWPSLLERKRVVVLGEPGSGKSEEFRRRAAELSGQGQAAFYVDLQRLVEHPLEDILRLTERLDDFHVWAQSDKPAWFFLDSVDESRLESAKHFEWALQRFRNGLGGDADQLRRAHIFVSSRIHAWRSETDLALLYEELQPEFDSKRANAKPQRDAAKQASKISPEAGADVIEAAEEPLDLWVPFLVRLAPLTLEQVEIYVAAQGADAAAFRKDVETSFLEPFVRRPLDVLTLLRYWRENGHFDSLGDMIDVVVGLDLKEPSPHVGRTALVPDRARSGAEMLAAAVILCRKRDIMPANQQLQARDTGALLPRDILPDDWSDDEITELLDRALFDVPIYGRIRFHHREVEEYLCACWLQRLYDHNLPNRSLKQLLLKEVNKQSAILRPYLAPVAAWLACLNGTASGNVRTWVKKTEPELFFRSGDAAKLPAEYKEQLLDALLEKYRGWGIVRIDADRPAMMRLADRHLGGYISCKCTDRTIVPSLRDDLLRLAALGRISDCAEAALQLIQDADEMEELKTSACAYLEAAGNADNMRRLVESAERLVEPSERLVGSLVTALFPRYIGKEALLSLIAKLPNLSKFTIGLPYRLSIHARAHFTLNEIVQLIEALQVLLSQGPPWFRNTGEQYRVGERFLPLANTIADLLPEVIAHQDVTAEQIAVCAKATWLVVFLTMYAEIHPRGNRDDLVVRLSQRIEVRQAYFCEIIRRLGELRSDERELAYSTLMSESIRLGIFGDSDIGWMAEQIQPEADAPDEYILAALRKVWAFGGQQADVARRVRRSIVSRAPRLKIEAYETFPGMFHNLWWRVYGGLLRTVGAKWWRKRRLRDIRGRYWHIRNTLELLWLLPKIRSGSHVGALWFLIKDAPSDNHLAFRDWEQLKARRGRILTSATKRGLMAYWPKYTPDLWFERATPNNNIDGRVILGLTGIRESVLTGTLDMRDVPQPTVLQLARYALNEINGLPDWFGVLTEEHKEDVRSIVMAAISKEWRVEASDSNTYFVLSTLAHHHRPSFGVFVESVAQLLLETEPKNPAILAQAFRLLWREPDGIEARIGSVAPDRCRRHPHTTRSHILWMGVWLQVDATAAMAQLEKVVTTAEDPADYLSRLASVLAPGPHADNLILPQPSFRSSDILSRLIVLYYTYLSPDTDPQYPAGEVHGSGSRDDAAQLRSQLVLWLSEIGSDEAGASLSALAKHPQLIGHRDWLRYLILKREKSLADDLPWAEQDVKAFREFHEIQPRNGYELFRLVKNRLVDIKDHVERGEDSPRNELHPQNDERDVRVWLAAKLRETAREMYVVPEEHELASGRREDIRVERPSVPGPCVIEVKQLEGWSLRHLAERLENQLAGDYLKPPNAEYGIYLITYTAHDGKGSSKKVPSSGERLNFERTVQWLQDVADRIVAGRPDIAAISVLGIDFVTV